jgi:beta-lactamase class A
MLITRKQRVCSADPTSGDAMKQCIALLLAGTTLVAGCRAESPRTPEERVEPESDLASAISERLAETGADFAVAYRDLQTRDELLIHPDAEFHAASMMKVPVMLRLHRMADWRQLDLDSAIEVKNEFTSIYDGSSYSLSAGEDSDSTVYSLIGSDVTIRDLMDRMISRSSNLATNILIEIADPDSITPMLASLRADGMKVLRGVEDMPAYENGLNNTTTARGLLELFSAIARGQTATPRATSEMIEALLRQEFNDGIPAGLPEGTPVAHKTGWITAVDHDGGIVMPAGRTTYVLVILTSGVEDETVTRTAAADVSRIIWEARLAAEGASEETE